MRVVSEQGVGEDNCEHNAQRYRAQALKKISIVDGVDLRGVADFDLFASHRIAHEKWVYLLWSLTIEGGDGGGRLNNRPPIVFSESEDIYNQCIQSNFR